MEIRTTLILFINHIFLFFFEFQTVFQILITQKDECTQIKIDFIYLVIHTQKSQKRNYHFEKIVIMQFSRKNRNFAL